MLDEQQKNVIGFTELKEKYLEHRYPILMLDRVTDYTVGESIEAIKCVTGNSPELVGHFPNRAIMPATFVLQAFAQLAIVFFKISNGQLAEDEITLISSIKARFLRPIFPGDTIHLKLATRKLEEAHGNFDCDSKVDGESVVKGNLTLAKTSLSKFEGAPW